MPITCLGQCESSYKLIEWQRVREEKDHSASSLGQQRWTGCHVDRPGLPLCAQDHKLKSEVSLVNKGIYFNLIILLPGICPMKIVSHLKHKPQIHRARTEELKGETALQSRRPHSPISITDEQSDSRPARRVQNAPHTADIVLKFKLNILQAGPHTRP